MIQRREAGNTGAGGFVRAAKRFGQKLLAVPPARSLFLHWTVHRVPILMLHRFVASDDRSGGTSAKLLERCTSFLRESRFETVTLGDLCETLRAGTLPSRTVCLTVDDGYRDFADIAVPILSRYGIPATVFVARDFIDGGRWYWWDRIDHAFVQTASHRARVRLGDRGTCEYSWNAPAEKALAQRRFTEDCKEIDDTAKWQAIEELETELRVEVPVDVPVRYRGVTWDDVRKLSDAGIEIGGHTVTHPILSRVPPERAEAEVVECLDAILHHTGKRPRTFAYPNGRRGDFTPWVMDVLDREGIIGAVTGEHGIVSAPLLDTLERPMYQLPRIAMPSTWEGFVQAVSGVEALKQQLGYR